MATEKWAVGQVEFRDEQTFVPGVSWEEIKAAQTPGPKPLGWYVQIVLKFAVAFHEDISEYYVVWDDDFLPLEAWPLLDDPRDPKTAQVAINNCYKTMDLVQTRSIKEFMGTDVVHQPERTGVYLNSNTQPAYIAHHCPMRKTQVREILAHQEEVSRTKGCNQTQWQICIGSSETCGLFTYCEQWTQANWVITHHPGEFSQHPAEQYCGDIAEGHRFELNDHPQIFKSNIKDQKKAQDYFTTEEIQFFNTHPSWTDVYNLIKDKEQFVKNNIKMLQLEA